MRRVRLVNHVEIGAINFIAGHADSTAYMMASGATNERTVIKQKRLSKIRWETALIVTVSLLDIRQTI